jgi:hypothetical protein
MNIIPVVPDKEDIDFLTGKDLEMKKDLCNLESDIASGKNPWSDTFLNKCDVKDFSDCFFVINISNVDRNPTSSQPMLRVMGKHNTLEGAREFIQNIQDNNPTENIDWYIVDGGAKYVCTKQTSNFNKEFMDKRIHENDILHKKLRERANSDFKKSLSDKKTLIPEHKVNSNESTCSTNLPTYSPLPKREFQLTNVDNYIVCSLEKDLYNTDGSEPIFMIIKAFVDFNDAREFIKQDLQHSIRDSDIVVLESMEWKEIKTSFDLFNAQEESWRNVHQNHTFNVMKKVQGINKKINTRQHD